ncbi:MAG: cytidine deaminase [Lachnospiraceae bacterium]|nr:cytidine deaminase [Lachnospiraceae bacterium]
MTDRELIRAAFEARKMSYSPYSGFQVGAALLAENGKIYTGCNIENAAYTPTNCAERTAFFKAVSEGVRGFQKIAVVGGRKDAKRLAYCAPCGVCRQVMREFCEEKTFRILLAVSEEEYREYRLEELLPESFGPDNLTIHAPEQKEAL